MTPVTLNDLLSQSDASCDMNTWCLWFRAKLNKTAVHHGLPFDISGTQSPSTPPSYRCLTLFAGFRLLKIQKVFLILYTAVIRTAVNYCFYCKSIDSCHGDMALKGWDFYWEENHSKLTLLHACGHFALFRLIISVWLQFACNLFTACVNTFNFSPTSLSPGSC